MLFKFKKYCLYRGLLRAVDIEASSLTQTSTADEGLKPETLKNVPWSLPSEGITGDLGRSRYKQYLEKLLIKVPEEAL